MPNIRAHCAISRQRTGFNFEELHHWIDHSPETKFLGPDHRIERHSYTIDDEKYIKSYWDMKKGSGWGDKAVVEWLFHIAIDNISTAYKKSKICYGDNTYNYIKIRIGTTGFINVDFDKIDDYQLGRVFRT